MQKNKRRFYITIGKGLKRVPNYWYWLIPFLCSLVAGIIIFLVLPLFNTWIITILKFK